MENMLAILSCWVTAGMAKCTSQAAIAKRCVRLQQIPELILAPRAAKAAKLLGALGVLGVQGVGAGCPSADGEFATATQSAC